MNINDNYILTNRDDSTEIVNIVIPQIITFDKCDFREDAIERFKNKPNKDELLNKEEEYFNSMNYVYVWSDFTSKTMRLVPLKYLCKQTNKSLKTVF